MARDASTAAAIEYQPALDGLRAVSVIAVLAFHGSVAGFGGGYLGVSVFFTLSGYLITSLLLAERERDGSIGVSGFYVRRAKRLLPASLLCLALITVLAGTTRLFDGVEALRRDLLGAALQVANWVFLGGNDSYQHLLARTAGQASPVEHYWSLAIEEQFYWLWPLAFLALWRVARTHRVATRVIAGITVAFAVAAPVIAAVWGPDAAYWATPARAAEILTGVLAAFVVHGRALSPRWAVAAPTALLALAVAVVTFPSDHGPAYHGALPLVAVASALLIVGLQVPGPARTALSAAPLVWLGRISYGVYLYHWPIYVLVDHRRTGLGTAALLGVRLALTLAVAIASFVLVERPVRRSTLRRHHVGVLAFATVAAVLVGVVVVVAPGQGSYWRGSAAASAAAIDAPADGTLAPLVAPTVASTAATSATSATSAPTLISTTTAAPSTSLGAVAATAAAATTSPSTVAASTTEPPLPTLARPMRVVVAGDSTAEATGAGLAQWAVDHPTLARVSDRSAEGCGLLRGGDLDAGGWIAWTDRCASWLRDLPKTAAKLKPDVVMLMTSSWDVLDRRWDGGPVETPFDADYRSRLQADFADLVDRLLAAGVPHVVFVREPAPVPLWGFGGVQAQSDQQRHQVTADVMAEQAAAHPGKVTVVDLLGWLTTAGLVDDHAARPDGVHWTTEVATRIATEFLGERLVRAALAS